MDLVRARRLFGTTHCCCCCCLQSVGMTTRWTING